VAGGVFATSRRLPLLIVAFAVLVGGIAVAYPTVSAAQEAVRRPWTLRDLFFGSRKSERVEPPPPPVTTKTRTRPSQPAARRPAAPAAPVVPKADEAKVVLVIGDFLGNGLAEGLEQVYAENPHVRVVSRTSGSSGFVRDDFYDWPAEAPKVVAAEKPAVIVVMLGANDRQQMTVKGTREAVLSDAWKAEYQARAEKLARALSQSGVPFVWVGVPSFKPSSMLRDMLDFNDFYRAAAEGTRAEFIDIWDGFVDEAGAYIQTGPDINGQPVRLRADDGINLTAAGKRKVAFYAEKPLAKLLGDLVAPGVSAAMPATPLTDADKPVDVDSIVRTAPISLRDPELDGGKELMGASVTTKHEARSAGERLLVDGIAPASVPGRADNFGVPVVIAAPVAPASESTTSITPAAPAAELADRPSGRREIR
jgi:hypothetical protein